MAIPAYGGASTAKAEGTSTVAPGIPSGVSTGDLMLAVLAGGNLGAWTVADQGGGSWTEIGQAQAGSGTTSANVTIFSDYYNGSQTAPTFNSPANNGVGRIIYITGARPGDEVTFAGLSADLSDVSGDTACSLASGFSTTDADCLIVLVAGAADDSPTFGATWTNANLANISVRLSETTTQGNDSSVEVVTGELATAGAVGTFTNTLTAAVNVAALVLAIRPPATGVALTIADATHGHSADNVSLTIPFEQTPDTDTSALSNDGTANWGNGPDRVQWWNGYQSRWDAVLPLTAPPAADASDWWIVGDAANPSAIDDMVLVDARTGSRPTTVWDEPNKRLYVVSEAVGGIGGSLIYAYDYDDSGDTYTVDSSVNGVSVGVVGMGGDSNTALTRTPNGHLWVASSRGGAGIVVNKSTDGGETWGTPLSLKATSDDGKVALNYFANGGTTYVCVAAGENGLANPTAIYHFLYIDSTSAGWGTAGNWTDDSSNIPALSANVSADDEMCMARDSSENIYFVSETEDQGSATSSDEQWVLFKRAPAGTWTLFPIAFHTGDPTRKRPTITIDTTNDVLYAFANTLSDTAIVYRSAALSSLGDLDTTDDTYLFRTGTNGYRNSHPPEHVTGVSDLLLLADQQTDDYVARILLPIDGATPLVIADATHAHAADNLALTQHNVLAIQDATHGHTADNAVLGVGLVVQDALHAHTADNFALTQHNVLAVQDASHAHAADNLALTQHNVLAIQDATHGHAADNLALTQHNVLAVADATHAHAADNLTLTANDPPGGETLIIQEAAHAHAADSLVLGVGLVIQDAHHAHRTDAWDALAAIGDGDESVTFNADGTITLSDGGDGDFWATADNGAMVTRAIGTPGKVEADVTSDLSQTETNLRFMGLRSSADADAAMFVLLTDADNNSISTVWRDTVGGVAGYQGEGSGVAYTDTLPLRGRVMYDGATAYAYVSTDGGSTWQLVNSRAIAVTLDTAFLANGGGAGTHVTTSFSNEMHLTQHNVLAIADALHAHTAEVPQLSLPGETPTQQDFVRLRRRRGMGTR